MYACVYECVPLSCGVKPSLTSLSTPTPPPKLTLPKLQMETDDEEEEKSCRDFLQALQKTDVSALIYDMHHQKVRDNHHQ